MTALSTIKYSVPVLKTESYELNNPISKSVKIHSLQDIHSFIDFQHDLCIEDISFEYPNGKSALDHMYFSIKKGQSVSFVGHLGFGKTTLADIISGLLGCKSGRILVDGGGLGQQNMKQWHRHLSYIP